MLYIFYTSCIPDFNCKRNVKIQVQSPVAFHVFVLCGFADSYFVVSRIRASWFREFVLRGFVNSCFVVSRIRGVGTKIKGTDIPLTSQHILLKGFKMIVQKRRG